MPTRDSEDSAANIIQSDIKSSNAANSYIKVKRSCCWGLFLRSWDIPRNNLVTVNNCCGLYKVEEVDKTSNA